MHTFDRGQLIFVWEEGGIRENLADFLQGLRVAYIYSLFHSDICRVVMPGYSDVLGVLEARTTVNRVVPQPITAPQSFWVYHADAYDIIESNLQSIYYALEIPGFCHIVDGRILTIAKDYEDLWPQIHNAIFNCTSSTGGAVPGMPPSIRPYAIINRTISMLTRKPRVPKTVNFLPIFTALFGEKIATVIMKEIK